MELFLHYGRKMEDLLAKVLKDLQPVPMYLVDEICSSFPGIPDEYVRFLSKHGSGLISLDKYGDFFILPTPLLASRDYFREEIYYSVSDFPAPLGEVVGVAADEEGSLYGFDQGDSWRLVVVDGRRDVVRLDLDFLDLIAGVAACHPQRPHRRVADGWQDELGNYFSVP